jgi:hypothetical protein
MFILSAMMMALGGLRLLLPWNFQRDGITVFFLEVFGDSTEIQHEDANALASLPFFFCITSFNYLIQYFRVFSQIIYRE